jgi:hypothetical protein
MKPWEPTKAAHLLVLALKEVGKPYVLGSEGPPEESLKTWDCSELVQHLLAQVGVVQVTDSKGRVTPINVFDGAGFQWERSASISLEAGGKLPGALLFIRSASAYPRKPHQIGHVAISLGNGYVLGLFLDERAPGFDAAMAQVAALWRERLERMLERVRRADGIELTWDDLYYTGHVPPVSPVAEAIARKRGDMSTGEAFRAYLDEGKPGYVAPLVDLAWVARMVHDLGGLCVMAHPWPYNPEVVSFTQADYRGMREMGVDGLECYHPGQPVEGLQARIELTRALGMVVSGGSDCHGAGPGQPIRIGSLCIPASLLDDMRGRVAPRG